MSERVCKGCGETFRNRRSNQWYCSENCRKRRWERDPANRGACADCGTVVWRSERCVSCHQQFLAGQHEALLRHIEKMWNDGVSMRGIAAALGRTGPHTVGQELDELRKAGRIGYRYKMDNGRRLAA